MAILQRREFEGRLQRAEQLIGALDSLPDPQARQAALDAVQAVLDLHGDTLERMLEVIFDSGPTGADLIDAVAADPMVSGLLLLHGLHPLGLEERVAQALEKVRPYLGSHGGNVELLGIRDGRVSLRLEGSCHGCASSAMTLKYAIEREIHELAPDVVAIDVEGAVEAPAPARTPAGFVPLGAIQRAPAWQTLEQLPELEPGELHRTQVDGREVLVCRLAGGWYAYAAHCPLCGRAAFTVVSETLECSGCGHRFDARRAGRSLEDAAVHLDPIPLLVEAGTIRVASTSG